MCKQVDFPSSVALVRISAGETFSRSASEESKVVSSSFSPVRAAYKRSSISSSLNWGAIFQFLVACFSTLGVIRFQSKNGESVDVSEL